MKNHASQPCFENEEYQIFRAQLSNPGGGLLDEKFIVKSRKTPEEWTFNSEGEAMLVVKDGTSP